MKLPENTVSWYQTLVSSLPRVYVFVWRRPKTEIITGYGAMYGKWRKEIIKLKSIRASLPRLFVAPIWESNCFAGPFITAGSNQQGRVESSDKLYCIHDT